MKLSRILSLLVAALVLAMPFGALADQIGMSQSYSNIHVEYGDINTTIEGTLAIDGAIDTETGLLNGTLAILNGEDALLKGGFEFSLADMKLTAGIENVPDAIEVPVGTLIEQNLGMSLEQLMTTISGIVEPLSSISLSEETTNKIMATVNEWVGANLPESGLTPEATATIVDLVDDTAVYELSGQRYDFSLKGKDIVRLLGDVLNTLKGDSAFIDPIQKAVDAIMALTGGESVNLSEFDFASGIDEAEEDATISGYLFMSETGYQMVIDITPDVEGSVTSSISFDILMREDGTVLIQNTTYPDEATSVAYRAEVLSTEPVAFTMDMLAVNNYSDSFSNQMYYGYSFDMTDGYHIESYVSNTSDSESYSTNMDITEVFDGDLTQTDDGFELTGILDVTVNQSNGETTETIKVSADVASSMFSGSSVNFEMPINRIDVTTADAETMEALSNEYMSALMNGYLLMMSIPGMSDLMPAASSVQ
ncbi:MAG: hypothetical protein IJJ23_02120 [Clostridia bacterium]|nr:hypothetical protein [Clostridia bacterium]